MQSRTGYHKNSSTKLSESPQILDCRYPTCFARGEPGTPGEERDLASSDEAKRKYAVEYTKKCVDLSAQFDDPTAPGN